MKVKIVSEFGDGLLSTGIGPVSRYPRDPAATVVLRFFDPSRISVFSIGDILVEQGGDRWLLSWPSSSEDDE